jgi:FkbM family methyltransferase
MTQLSFCDLDRDLPSTTKELGEEFINVHSRVKRYAFGRNDDTLALSKAIKLDGVIDDFAPVGSFYGEIPVVKAESVSKDAIVVNCTSSISPVNASKRLRSLGLIREIPVASLHFLAPDRFELPLYVRETRDCIKGHVQDWEKLYANLADEASRRVLKDIVLFRVSGDSAYMKDYQLRMNEQYFEDFLALGAGESFVDCGGFDGDTTEEFIRRCPHYGHIYFFEPSPKNLAKAKARIADHSRIEFLEEGVSDKEQSVCFNFAGSASSISESGEERIHLITIDSLLAKVPVTLIKMDLEGWELKALDGARDCIKSQRPKLAIAAYHRASDFIDIFQKIRLMMPDCKIYLRHYTQGWSETVMFFVP